MGQVGGGLETVILCAPWTGRVTVLVGPDVLPEDGFPRPPLAPLTRLQSGSFWEHRGPFLGSQRTREPAGPRDLPKALTLSPDVAL